MSSVDQGQRSNEENLSRLRGKSYFKKTVKTVTKYELDENALNLKKPSDEVVASNRAEIKSYLKRRRIAGFVFVLLVVIAVCRIIYLMS